MSDILLRQTTEELRLLMQDAGADSVSVSWGQLTLHVTADTARAVLPDGHRMIELVDDAAYARLAGLVEIEAVADWERPA